MTDAVGYGERLEIEFLASIALRINASVAQYFKSLRGEIKGPH